MARELVMMLWCDFCAELDQSEAGEEHIFTVDSGKPLAMVACEVHDKEIVAPFIEALSRLGIPTTNIPAAPAEPKARKVKGTRAAPVPQASDPVECQICVDVFGVEQTLKNRETLSVHRKQLHGVTALEYRAFLRGDATVKSKNDETREVLLEVKPLPPAGEPYDIPADYRCGIGDCESAFDPRDFARGEDGAFRAVAGHRTSSHKSEVAA